MSAVVADAVPKQAAPEDIFPASVTITRTSEEDFKSRQLIVWLDGERIETLMWGDSITREIEPGMHRLRVSNTLVWKTVEFTVRAGQQVFFEVVNRTGLGSIPMMLVLGVGPLYVTVRRMDA